MRINEYDNHPKHFVYTTVHFYPLNSLLRHLQNLQWVRYYYIIDQRLTLICRGTFIFE